MRAGPLDRRMELRHRVLTQNSKGEQVPSWPTAYATVWAGKRDVSVRERFAAQQAQAELDTIFQIRYRPDVLATDRAFVDGREYDIRPGRELGRRVGLEILATAVVP